MSETPQQTNNDATVSSAQQQTDNHSDRPLESSEETNPQTPQDTQPTDEGELADATPSQPAAAQTPTCGNATHETSPPADERARERQQVFRKVQNRSIALSFALSLVSPIINFAWSFPATKTMGVTLSLMLWVLFGGFWCLGFAQVMGPCFYFVAKFILHLDVIPGLGTCLWTLLSTLLMVCVITDDALAGFPAFLNNLPLFSLIYANGLILSEAFPNFGPHDSKWTADEVHGPSNRICKVGAFYFRNGTCSAKLFISENDANPIYSVDVEQLSVPGDVVAAYEKIKANASQYIQGTNLDNFAKEFKEWKTHVSSMRKVFTLRRLLYFTGFVFDSVAVFGCFYLLPWINFSHGSETTSQETQSILLLIFKVVLQVMLCALSEYFELLFKEEEGLTTHLELFCIMIYRLGSPLIDWSSDNSNYLSNGRNYHRPPGAYKHNGIRAKNLPLIGIVLDKDESEKRNQTILRSFVAKRSLVCQKIEEGRVTVQPLVDEHERQTLSSTDEGMTRLYENDVVN